MAATMRPAAATPRSARMSTSSSSASMAASSRRFVTKSALAPPIDAHARALPPPRPARPLVRTVVHGGCRDSDLPMSPEEIQRRVLYRDGLMLVVDKPAGQAVHPGPKGGPSL